MSALEAIRELEAFVNRHVIGQERLINRLFLALLADGHLLVEGVPGLAKTTAVKELAAGLEGDFHRVQFTPDLLPADLIGTEVFRPEEGTFQFQPGPIFHHCLLADEINRSPAKVQSALLEAMAERQVTVGRVTYPLPDPFLVMATQNPIEQEGTYPLPEAQRDRFLLHVRVDYPDAEAEHRILRLVREQAHQGHPVREPDAPMLAQETVFEARNQVLDLHMAEPLEEYLVRLVAATRDPAPFGDDLAGRVEYGASPRATLALDRCARAHAWLAGRDFVAPEDIQALAPDVLRHRVLLTFEAEAEGVTQDGLIAALLERVAVS